MAEPVSLHRRGLLLSATGVFAATGAGLAGWSLLRATAPAADTPSLRTPLSAIPDVGLLTKPWGGGMVSFLRRDPAFARSLFVFHPQCGFDHCSVIRDAGARLRCPCCGSGFDLGGRRLFGPARTDLAPVPYRLDGDVVVVEART